MPQSGSFFSDNVRLLAKRQGLTLKSLAAAAGVRYDWLRRAVSTGLERSGSYNATNVQRIAGVLGIEERELWYSIELDTAERGSVLESVKLLPVTTGFEAYHRAYRGVLRTTHEQLIFSVKEALLAKFDWMPYRRPGERTYRLHNAIGPLLDAALDADLSQASLYSQSLVSDAVRRISDCKAWQELHPHPIIQTTFALEFLTQFEVPGPRYERPPKENRTAKALIEAAELHEMKEYMGYDKWLPKVIVLRFPKPKREDAQSLLDDFRFQKDSWNRMSGQTNETVRAVAKILDIVLGEDM